MLQRLGISVGPGFRDWLEQIKDITIQHITAETELMAEKCSESSELILILSWILIITSRPHILIIMHSSLQWFSSKRLHMESDTAGYVVMREWSMICYHPELIFLKQHTLKCFIPLKPKPKCKLLWCMVENWLLQSIDNGESFHRYVKWNILQ